jgi:hypothetical protein
LGLHFGRAKGDDISRKVTTYEKAVEFFESFKVLNGATDCKALLQGLDMHNPADLKKIESFGLFKTSCYKYAKDAVEIAEKMIHQG